MTVYELKDGNSLHISDDYQQMLGEEGIEKTQALLGKVKFPENEVGMVALDHIIQKNGLLLIVAMYNNKVDELKEEYAEIHLYDGEGQKVASGAMGGNALPTMKKGEVHFWHFFLPHAAFLVSDVKLGNYYVELIGKDDPEAEQEGSGEERTFNFYHIMMNDQEAATPAREDNRAHVTLMSSPIEYASEISLEAVTKKKKD